MLCLRVHVRNMVVEIPIDLFLKAGSMLQDWKTVHTRHAGCFHTTKQFQEHGVQAVEDGSAQPAVIHPFSEKLPAEFIH